jgi:fluoroquinolone resistance protein
MSGCTFTGATLASAVYSGTQWTGCKFQGCTWKNLGFVNCQWNQVDILDCHCNGITGDGVKGEKVFYYGSFFENSEFRISEIDTA